MSRAVDIDQATARTAKANVSFGGLSANAFWRNKIKVDTKLDVYKVVVLQTLLYVR